MARFPKELFVQEYRDVDGTYFVADGSALDAMDEDLGENKAGHSVALYVRKSVGRIDQVRTAGYRATTK